MLISVSKEPREGIVSCHSITIRERLLRKLFGHPQSLTIVVPGESVDEVSITEINKGGESHKTL